MGELEAHLCGRAAFVGSGFKFFLLGARVGIFSINLKHYIADL
jgi:hypothetical protein